MLNFINKIKTMIGKVKQVFFYKATFFEAVLLMIINRTKIP